MASFSYNGTTDEDDLISDVQYWADKALATGQTIGPSSADVYEALVAAMQTTLNGAPRAATDHIADDGKGQTVTSRNEYSEVALPDTFLELLELRLASWGKEAYRLHDPRGERVRRQYDSHTRSDAANPVVTKVPSPDGNGEQLRCWPQGSGPSIDRFLFVPQLAPEEVPQDLKHPMVFWAGAYVLTAEKEEGAQPLQQAARLMLRQIDAGMMPLPQQALSEADDDS
jgi:hypothetical protein